MKKKYSEKFFWIFLKNICFNKKNNNFFKKIF